MKTVYSSHSIDAGRMLAIWVDHRPSEGKDQRDPDGWVTGVSGTDYEIERLAELAKVTNARFVKLHGYAAEWWSKIQTNRRRAASKERNAKARDAQQLFAIPPDVEELGRQAAYVRSRR